MAPGREVARKNGKRPLNRRTVGRKDGKDGTRAGRKHGRSERKEGRKAGTELRCQEV
jgi:hypothetical protein